MFSFIINVSRMANMPIYMSRLRKLHGQRQLPLAYIERDKYSYIPSVGSTLI